LADEIKRGFTALVIIQPFPNRHRRGYAQTKVNKVNIPGLVIGLRSGHSRPPTALFVRGPAWGRAPRFLDRSRLSPQLFRFHKSRRIAPPLPRSGLILAAKRPVPAHSRWSQP